MARSTEVKVKFTGDARDLQRATNNVESSMGGLGGKMGGFAKTIAGAVASAFVVDKIITFGAELFNLGNTAEINMLKAETVFGDQAGMMEQWAADNAGAMGLTKTELLGLSAGMADLLVPMGATREEAATMTQGMAGLSGALSLWSGGTRSSAEVQEILTKALLGERDALVGLGIKISEAEVQSRALEIATADGRTEITAMDKALATEALIYDKTTDAQAAFTDGTFDAQIKQQELKAQFNETKESLGTALLPAFQKLTAWILEDVIPALTRFKDWIWPKLQAVHAKLVEWWDKNGPKIMAKVETVKNAVSEMGAGIKGAWNDYIKPAVDSIKEAFGELGDKLSELKGEVSEDTGSININWETVGRVIGVVLGGVAFSIGIAITVLSGMVQAVLTLYRTARTAGRIMATAFGIIKTAVSTMAGPAKTAISGVTTVINTLKRAVNFLKEAFATMKRVLTGRISIPTPKWPSPPGWMKGIIPGYHAGTHSVPGTPGETVPAMLQAGEVVLSTAQVRQRSRGGGGGGTTVIVNAYGVTGREMVAEIERAVRDGVRSQWLTTAGVTS